MLLALEKYNNPGQQVIAEDKLNMLWYEHRFATLQ